MPFLFSTEPFRLRKAEDLLVGVTSRSKTGLFPKRCRGAAAARPRGRSGVGRTMVAVAAPPTATAARAALRGRHVARAARSRDGSRGALGSPPPRCSRSPERRRRDSAFERLRALAEPSNGAHARGCGDVRMRRRSLGLRVPRFGGSELPPL